MAAVKLCRQPDLSDPTSEPWTSHTIGGDTLSGITELRTLQLLQLSISLPSSLSDNGPHDRISSGDGGLSVSPRPNGAIPSTSPTGGDSERTISVADGALWLDIDIRQGSTSVTSSSERGSNRFGKAPATPPSKSKGANPGGGSKYERSSERSDGMAPDISKRQRASHDVDGPDTGHLPCKKRRLRHRLITSRLSQPYSLPATHILNRETGEDTPVLSRFLKFAAMGPKKAGHQTAMVRKAAILNRVRLNVRQAAVSRGHDRMWRMSDMSVMGHGLQLVTASTGAMFPGRGSAAGMSLPHVWRPHTTGGYAGGAASAKNDHSGSHASHQSALSSSSPADTATSNTTGSSFAEVSQQQPFATTSYTPVTSIMTPLHHDEAEESTAFPVIDDDYRYADLSDDDMDDVYTDFGALFGGGAAKSPGDGPRDEEEEHFYEEYLDELDGIPWA